MKKGLRFPIRLKILVTLLIVVTAVVSAIVLTMAGLFHQDKKTYITDLVAMRAVSHAEECRTILVGYRERLQVYDRIIGTDSMSRQAKAGLLREFFDDFPELVAVSLGDGREEIAAVYNDGVLQRAGLAKADFLAYLERRPLPVDRILEGEDYVRNSTLSAKLPTLTLAMARPSEPEGEARLLTAVIQLTSLLRITSRSEAFEAFLTDSDGNYLAHASLPVVVGRGRAMGIESGSARSDGTVMAREYSSHGVEMIGGRASARFAGVTAETRVPKSTAHLASRDLLSRLVGVALALLLTSALLGLLGAYRLTRPVQTLTAATREIAKGDFETQVEVDSRDEIGELAGSFNQMAAGLREREIALEEAQSQLIQSEKLAAFGQLGAGIAHEVKNPLAGILGCAQLSLRKVEKGTQTENNLRLIEKETKRCKEIIDNLLRFARQESAVLRSTFVNPVVNDAAAIVNHQLGMHKIDLELNLAEELPVIHGNANQLQQVLMNLIMNAQQAMEGAPGTIRVSTRVSSRGQVEIAVTDTGPGIPDEIKEKLFEPFFTTKPGGKGTGLA